jgi:hypothetical protein
MDIQTIIAEADVRVPNAFSSEQKVDWLNEVNNEFFDVVKIPKVATVATDGNVTTFTVPNDVREKGVRKVVVGSNFYRSIIYENITAAFNYYTIKEDSNQIVFTPKPPSGTAVIVYDQIAVSPFLSANLTVQPESPSEYHWVYILGLSVRIAKAMNDVTLANNYENDFKSNLAIAQQNFARG